MIQVREYATITTATHSEPSLDRGIVSKETFDWLIELNEGMKNSFKLLVVQNNQELKLNSYVGYIQSPNGEGIEILPKTGLGQDNPEDSRAILQKVLMSSLQLEAKEYGAAKLNRTRLPIHEWIFKQFLDQLKLLVSRGLRHDYDRVEEEARFIRGQLNIAAQQRQPPGKAHLFHIRHDVYSPNRIENRLIKTALSYVKKFCKSAENWRLANELSHYLDVIPEIESPMSHFHQWQNTKLMQPYNAIKPWCRLLLEQLNPSFQKGRFSGITLLFPMEQLFESHVTACLQSQVSAGSKVLPQRSSKYLLTHTPEGSDVAGQWFQLKPDLLLSNIGSDQVLDIKWKLLDADENTTYKKYNISQSDLYQLFAYGHKYQNGFGDLMLIYPKHKEFKVPLPKFSYSPDLQLWVVPFCIETDKLINGEWEHHFSNLTTLKLKDIA